MPPEGPPMRTQHLCLVALVAAACNEHGSTDDVEIIDNREGVYDYVLGDDAGANQDMTNRNDRDRLSPLEKYDLLFNPNQTRQVEAVSHCTFPDSQAHGGDCTQVSHPAITVAGPATEWELENQGQYQQYEPD